MTNQISENAQARALSQLIKDMGIDTLSQDKQNELIIKMTEVLLKRIFLETMDKLGERGREEYEKMSEGEISAEQIEVFFKQKIQGYDKMVEGIIEEFKGEMIATKA